MFSYVSESHTSLSRLNAWASFTLMRENCLNFSWASSHHLSICDDVWERVSGACNHNSLFECHLSDMLLLK